MFHLGIAHNNRSYEYKEMLSTFSYMFAKNVYLYYMKLSH
jgi:hypothetical protein